MLRTAAFGGTVLAGCVWCTTALNAVAFGQESVVPGEPALGYLEGGAGAVTVVVLHGGPGATYDYLLPEWSRLGETARVVFYDQRGCGRSGEASSYGWQDHVADLDRVLDAVGAERAVLAGSSWGSVLAVAYAWSRPRRVLGLALSGFPGWLGQYVLEEGGLPKRLEARLDSVNRGLNIGAPYRADTVVGPSTVAVDSVARILERRVGSFCEDVYHGSGTSAQALPNYYELAAITTSALLLRGDTSVGPHQPRDGSGELATILRNARVVTMRGAHEHDPWLSHPDVFFAVVQDFIQGLTSELP